MSSAPLQALPGDRTATPAVAPVRMPDSGLQRVPFVPLLLAVVLAGFTLFPPVNTHRTLIGTFLGVSGFLAAWSLVLWAVGARRGLSFRVEPNVIRAHWVQALVQFTITLYWGWYVAPVYLQLPLILAQILFLYAFDALLTWSRGLTWRIGFGPLPIILSTNLLLWFKDDWYYLQFAMVATGALGKQFVQWTREGRRTHIFNPSTFGQTVFALALIATGTTAEMTWGKEIAAWFDEPPRMFLMLFLVGLIVQALFQVTLMTLAAVATLVALNSAYTHFTGVYFFLSANFGAAVFLGVHLLITDPATSPRSNTGRVIFGVLYGALYFGLYRVLDNLGVPLFWDKLLPVPIINLLVPVIDRVARSGLVGRFNRWWETSFAPKKANLVHMGCWATLFGWMYLTGYVEAPHPGSSINFWRTAWQEGKPLGERNFKKILLGEANKDSAPAWNMLGVQYIEGQLMPVNHAAAANCFARACELGDLEGCNNTARLFLMYGEAATDEAVAGSLARLELEASQGSNGESCFLLGFAYENGRGVPADSKRSLELYLEGCRRGYQPACERVGQ